jgi:hypothetical protein
MDESMTSSTEILKAMSDGLTEAADKILAETNLMIDDSYEAERLKEVLEIEEAKVFVGVALETNGETNKARYTSDKARDMATIVGLDHAAVYWENKIEYRTKKALIEKRKATILRLHEQRRDLMAYIEFAKICGVSFAEGCP